MKAFTAWEDVVELVDQGIIQKSTVDLLIKEVGAEKSQTLTFDQFWRLVTLLEEASDAAADRVSEDMDESDDGIDMSPEEEEEMTRLVFDDLKNPKTGLVSSKKLKNWGSIAEALDSGELSKGMLNSAIKKVGAELDFEMFKQMMTLLEVAMEERAEEDDVSDAPVVNVTGKGFAKSAAAAPVVEAAAVAEAPKKAAAKAAPAKESDNEANAITKEIYEELRGNVSDIIVSHQHLLVALA